MSLSATQARFLRLLFFVLLLAFTIAATSNLYAEVADQVIESVDVAKLLVLPNHHPYWAAQRNSTGVLPPDTALNHLTLVLARSPQQEAALRQACRLVADRMAVAPERRNLRPSILARQQGSTQ